MISTVVRRAAFALPFDHFNYRATLCVAMPFRTLCVLLRRGASRSAFPRWSVGNDKSQLSCDATRRAAFALPFDHFNYRATLCVAMPFRTLCVLLRRGASRTAFPRWSVGNDKSQLSCDTPRLLCRSITSTIVRRSASPCRSGRSASSWRRGASRSAFPRWSVGNDKSQLSCGTPRLLCRSITSTIVRRSASPCRSGRSASSWRRRASRAAFPRWSVGNEKYQLLCDAQRLLCRSIISTIVRRSASPCRSGRSASSCDAERRELHSHAGA
ncbi:hypothetical protein K0038_01574 [Pseudomonas syringae]|nr:hypothetical protein [Pseudomonas syringae]